VEPRRGADGEHRGVDGLAGGTPCAATSRSAFGGRGGHDGVDRLGRGILHRHHPGGGDRSVAAADGSASAPVAANGLDRGHQRAGSVDRDGTAPPAHRGRGPALSDRRGGGRDAREPGRGGCRRGATSLRAVACPRGGPGVQGDDRDRAGARGALRLARMARLAIRPSHRVDGGGGPRPVGAGHVRLRARGLPPAPRGRRARGVARRVEPDARLGRVLRSRSPEPRRPRHRDRSRLRTDGDVERVARRHPDDHRKSAVVRPAPRCLARGGGGGQEPCGDRSLPFDASDGHGDRRSGLRGHADRILRRPLGTRPAFGRLGCSTRRRGRARHRRDRHHPDGPAGQGHPARVRRGDAGSPAAQSHGGERDRRGRSQCGRPAHRPQGRASTRAVARATAVGAGHRRCRRRVRGGARVSLRARAGRERVGHGAVARPGGEGLGVGRRAARTRAWCASHRIGHGGRGRGGARGRTGLPRAVQA